MDDLTKKDKQLDTFCKFLEKNAECTYDKILAKLETIYKTGLPSKAELLDMRDEGGYWEYAPEHHNYPLDVVKAILLAYKRRNSFSNVDTIRHIFDVFNPNTILLAIEEEHSFTFFYQMLLQRVQPADMDHILLESHEDFYNLPSKIFEKVDGIKSGTYSLSYLLLMNLDNVKLFWDSYEEIKDVEDETDPYFAKFLKLAELETAHKIQGMLRATICYNCFYQHIFQDMEGACHKCAHRNLIIDKVVKCIETTETQNLEGALKECYKDITIKTGTSITWERNNNNKPKTENTQVYDHNKINEYLSEYIFNQKELVRTISTGACTYLNVMRKADNKEIEHPYGLTVLVGGDTGTGKTYTLNKIAEKLNVPFISIDCTRLTPEGYVGDSLHDILKQAEKTIISHHIKEGQYYNYYPYILMFDEIDKLLAVDEKVSGFYASVQAAMLKVIESGIAESQKKDKLLAYPLVILAGSFMHSRNKNVNKSNSIGFFEAPKETAANINSEELIKYGLYPELVGRISVITETNTFKEEDYVKILTEAKDSALDKYKIFAEDLQIKVTKASLKKIVKEAAEYAVRSKTGVRGLETYLMSKVLNGEK